MPWITIGPYEEYKTFVDDIDVGILEEKYFYFDGRYVKYRKSGKRNGPDKPRDPATILYLHRVIVSAPVGFDVDHIDHDPLNNSRANLRICTRQENASNREALGIYWNSSRQVWQAKVMHNYKSHYCGSYTCAEEAISAYRKKCRELRGEFAFDYE